MFAPMRSSEPARVAFDRERGLVILRQRDIEEIAERARFAGAWQDDARQVGPRSSRKFDRQ